MTFWAYMLHCRGGAFYTGHTNDLEHRIAQHQSGLLPGFTADKLPVALVWSQEFPTRAEALAAERQIKGWSRAKKIALIRGDWGQISALAKKKGGALTGSARTGLGERGISESDRPEPIEGPYTNPSPGPVRPKPIEGANSYHSSDPVRPVRGEEPCANPSPNPVRPELVEGQSLICHPDTPCAASLSISVIAVRKQPGSLYLRFIIDGEMDKIVMATRRAQGRADGLWQTTCCEVFLKPVGRSDYLEFNLSPSTAWASYHFDDYRSGMREGDVVPNFDRIGGIFQALLDFSDRPDLHDVDWQLGLSAVIEEVDGTKSYWALRHPPGPPDFHHADCFALTLAAPPAA